MKSEVFCQELKTDLCSSPIAFGHSLIMHFRLSCPIVSLYVLQQSYSHDRSHHKNGIRYANTVHIFKRLLKTHLFRKAYLL